jgi:hypothetical protein
LTVSGGRIPHPCSISFSRVVYLPGGSLSFSPLLTHLLLNFF